MSKKPVDIILGEKKYVLRKLKLGQTRRVMDGLNDLGDKTGGEQITATCEVIVAGLIQSHPELTIQDLLDTEASVAELQRALTAIIEMEELRPAGEAIPQLAAA